MFQMRDQHVEALQRIPLDVFRREMVELFEQSYPGRAKSLEQRDLIAAIDQSVARAESYGLTNRGPCRLFIELAFRLGHQFDVDPQYAWAEAALCDETDVTQAARADRLYEAAVEYFDAVFGPDGQQLEAAVGRLAELPFAQIAAHKSLSEAEGLQLMETLYPEKYAFLAAASAQRLFAASVQSARQLVALGEYATVLILIGSWYFGHRYLDDKFHGLVTTIPDDAGRPTEESNARQLYERMIVLAQQWIA